MQCGSLIKREFTCTTHDAFTRQGSQLTLSTQSSRCVMLSLSMSHTPRSAPNKTKSQTQYEPKQRPTAQGLRDFGFIRSRIEQDDAAQVCVCVRACACVCQCRSEIDTRVSFFV